MAKILRQTIDTAGYVRCLVEVDKTESVEFKLRKDEDVEKRCDELLTLLIKNRKEQQDAATEVAIEKHIACPLCKTDVVAKIIQVVDVAAAKVVMDSAKPVLDIVKAEQAHIAVSVKPVVEVVVTK